MDGNDSGSGLVIGMIGVVVALVVIAVMVAAMWKVFAKAGQPGWAALVPIYNLVVLLNIVGKPLWWIILFAVPIANIYALFAIAIALAKSFGKSTGFGLGLVFLSIFFYPVLGFGSARYVGPATA
jgi:Family of unknown function (DUF5684)